MDFIKTSSLRALIELTFQRNWNGLIWMSRKGVIAKRVKTAPDGSIENQRRTRSPAGRGTMFRARPKYSVRLKSRPKSKPPADHASRPGKHCPRSAKPQRTPRARPCARAGNKPRGRATRSRTTADASVRAGKTSHVRPRNHRPNLIRSDHAGRPNHPATTVPTRPKTRLSGRSSRPTVRTPRSTRSRF
ncbi:unnamed protein product [Microthlaspi erraticum]|uniref:Uncharacterized protein n=1 Tax=Microthlaspi erraticum TaxID=1685480 RepID=A0A6D2JWL4_9BRAS|nr:unnamed protein product [Microthlaspi erraticum]